MSAVHILSLDAELECDASILNEDADKIPSWYADSSMQRNFFCGVYESLLALLCRLVDGWAQEPMKDVPSCDKPGGGAWNL